MSRCAAVLQVRLATVLAAASADAQYFGRNKVQNGTPRLPHATHRSLRHLLLPGRRAGDEAGRAHGGALGMRATRSCLMTRSPTGR